MKAIFSVVIASAAMMRSPSFSRSVESRTTINSPFPILEINFFPVNPQPEILLEATRDEEVRIDILKASTESSIESNRSFFTPLTGIGPSSPPWAYILRSFNIVVVLVARVEMYNSVVAVCRELKSNRSMSTTDRFGVRSASSGCRFQSAQNPTLMEIQAWTCKYTALRRGRSKLCILILILGNDDRCTQPKVASASAAKKIRDRRHPI